MSYQETSVVSLWKRHCSYPRCVLVCLCICAQMYAPVHALSGTPFFRVPAYNAQVCVQEGSDVIVLMMIMMMVFIYLWRWKKVDGGWMSAVSGAAESGARARKSEGAGGKRESGEEGWIVLCVGNERKERASCGMFTCQCSSSSDWSDLGACVPACVCVLVSSSGFPHWNTRLPHAII